MPFSLSIGSGWKFTHAEYLPALGAGVYNLAEVLAEPHAGFLTEHLAVNAIASVAIGLLMAFRLRRPRATATLAVIGDWFVYAPAAVLLALFTLAQRGRVRTAWTVGTLLTVVNAFTPWIRGFPPYDVLHIASYSSGAMAFVVAPVIVGAYLRTRHVRIVSLSEYTDRLEREQQLLAEAAQAEERTRIAREMHDVVAHRITHVVVHAGALELGADKGAEWVTKRAELIRTSGTQALDELRGILGFLQPSGHDYESAPLEPPEVRALERLVDGTRATGTQVNLSREESATTVPTALRATAYRVVQEALTNAVKHAPGAPITVEVCYPPGTLLIRVTNGPTATPARAIPGGGNGLAGLRRRVREHGGTFTTGPTTEGGFHVEAQLPLGHGASSPFPAQGEK
ncbi:sensor histidine kinase [Streptomyces olivoreticuli]|uniref:sensor histidine kinase n=1 Tax=Streptomyces olivoreticuli TaxID=68246 RepID=UPI000E259E78|nr:histidine kinase [Streptomyces olivoreticuli]